MNKIIIFENKKTKTRGYRNLPMNFINSWKVGAVISDESGEYKCEIIEIVDSQDVAKSKVEEYNKANGYRTTKYTSREINKLIENYISPLDFHFNKRPSLSSKVKKLRKLICNLKLNEIEMRSLLNFEIDDLNIYNIINCITVIKANDKKISTKIIKRKTDNTLSYNSISEYIEEDIKSLEVILSIVDSKYNVSLENDEIILFKNNKEYTLEIIHQLKFEYILNRLPKYMALKKKT